jgi:hypothetical protein
VGAHASAEGSGALALRKKRLTWIVRFSAGLENTGRKCLDDKREKTADVSAPLLFALYQGTTSVVP